MKSRWSVGGGALFGFAVGILVGPRISPIAPASSKEATNASEAGSGFRNQDDIASSLQSESRRSGASRPNAAKSSEPKIAIPLSEVSKLVVEHFENREIFGGMMGQLEFCEGNFEDVFVLMGFSERERQDTKAVFERAAAQLRVLERSNAKVRKSGPDEVELDFSDVRKASFAVLEEARQDFLKAVPDARGQSIAEAIQWDTCVYGVGVKDGKVFPNESIRLQIVRQRDGLAARSHWGRVISSSPLPKGDYSDDGSPISAAGLFDSRWQPWLSGVHFVPVDGE
jgi:hypothetical protein